MRLILMLAPLARALVPPGSTVAVIGSTGKLGRCAVRELVAQGYRARCLLRHDAAGAAPRLDAPDATAAEVAAGLAELPNVELARGDVTDAASVAALLEGCSAVLAVHGARRTRTLADLLPWVDHTADAAHAKRVNYEGVRNVLDAARASGTVRRVVRVTGKGESPWSIFSILINLLGSCAKAWNYEGEELLRAQADVDYTIVRPGVMGPPPPPGATLVLADDGGDLPVSPIAHADIARLCVASLAAPNAARATLCAMTAPAGEGEASWAPLLARVGPDRRAFPTDMFRRHLLAVRVGGLGLAAGFGLFATAAFAVLRAIVRAAAGLLH